MRAVIRKLELRRERERGYFIYRERERKKQNNTTHHHENVLAVVVFLFCEDINNHDIHAHIETAKTRKK